MQRSSVMEQTLYIPYSQNAYSNNELEILKEYEEEKISVVAEPIKTNMDRVFYFKKIKKYAKVLDKVVDVRNYQVMHAHSLFSNG